MTTKFIKFWKLPLIIDAICHPNPAFLVTEHTDFVCSTHKLSCKARPVNSGNPTLDRTLHARSTPVVSAFAENHSNVSVLEHHVYFAFERRTLEVDPTTLSLA